MKIAILGIGHWHSPIYAGVAQQAPHQLVGVHDDDDAMATIKAGKLATRGFTDPAQLLDETQPEFAVCLGNYRRMPELAALLIDRQIPFLIEKPAGVGAAPVRALAARCRATHLFHAPALIPYWFPAFQELRAILESGQLGRPARVEAQYFAGPVARYIKMGSPWMLDPQLTPGGALLNLGVLCLSLLRLLGLQPVYHAGIASQAVNQGPIEDFSSLLLDCRDGAYAVVETGYCPVDPQEGLYLNLMTEKGRAEFRKGLLRVEYASGEVVENRWPDSDFRKEMMLELLELARDGKPSPLSLDDMAEVLEICDAFYQEKVL
ncbi:MAG: Gfo/Idh/MocA family oxidoreductase [Candidatus Marinimicrobia bacterium]|nr:Gfo/Idh/MocA family oxidoreductase [Candidatus Neomarinimicrobiota bacterium]